MKNTNKFKQSLIFSTISWKALIILILGLSFTLIGTFFINRDIATHAKYEFASVCNDIKAKINSRLHAHAQLLRSGSALFSASDSVSRNEWKRFYEMAKCGNNLPGMQGVGYSIIIAKNQLQKHINIIQKEGFPNYLVKPTGNRNIYTSIIYIEPFAERNLRAFGYDMFSEPIRRQAMEQSCDFDIAAISGKVTLVQETNKDVQTGTLMYVPVYKKDMPTNTIEQRRAAIKGWVYSPYRMNDLMLGILGRWDSLNKNRIHLQIYDSDTISNNSLLFDSQQSDTLNHHDSFSQTLSLPINFNGTTWFLYFTKTEEQASVLNPKVIIAFIGGTLISLLLFMLALSLLNTKTRAIKIAKKLTYELQQNEEKYKTLYKAIPDCVFIIDKQSGNIEDVNTQALNQYGFSYEEFITLKHIDISAEPEKTKAATEKVINYISIRYHKKKDGTIFPCEISASSIEIDGLIKIFAVIRDITERKQVEEALQLSNERLIEAQKIAKIGNWEANLLTDELYWSQTIFDIFALDSKSFKPSVTAFHNAVQPNDRELVLESEKRSELTGLHDVVHRIILPSGEIRYVHELARRCKDNQGKLIKLHGTVQDITELKITEEKLKQSEEKFRLMISNSSDSYVLINKNGEQIFISEAATKATGYTIEELLGPIANVIYEVDVEMVLKTWNEVLINKDEIIRVQYRHKHKEKGFVWFEAVVQNLLDHPALNAVVVNVRDITESKKADDLLHKSEAKYRNLVENINDVIYILDCNGNITYISQSINKVFGYNAEDIIGKSFFEFIAETDKSFVSEAFLKTLIGETISKEYKIRTKIGEEKWIIASSKPIYLNGKFIEIYGIMSDITERKHNQELQQILKIAEKTNKMNEQFLANMNHELRTPLNGVMGMADILSTTYLDETQKEYLHTIKTSANELLTIIENILNITNLKSGQTKLYEKTINTEQLKNNLQIIYKKLIDKKSIAIAFEIKSDLNFPQQIISDEKQITQLITHLLSNAIKFSQTGTIKINFSQQERTIEFVKLKVEVSDTGIGISNEVQKNIFLNFNQAEVSNNRTYGGMGLGLAICKEIAQLMNGELGVNSELEKGSTFWFTFVAKIPKETSNTILENNKLEITKEVKILVVEDDFTNRKVITIMLENLNSSVITAENGLDALEKFEEGKYDIIFMDIQMPIMNGVEAIKELKAKYKKLPIIIGLSANAMEGDAEKYIELGLDDYITKPINMKQLQAILDKWLKNKK